MSETTESLDITADPQLNLLGDTVPATSSRGRRGSGLSGMVLTDLKALAGQLGIKGTSGMRKGDLVAAIAARQNGGERGATSEARSASRSRRDQPPCARRTEAAPSEPTQPIEPTERAEAAARASVRPVDRAGATAHADHAPSNGSTRRPSIGARRSSARGRRATRKGAAGRQPVSPAGGDEGGQRNRRNRRGRRDDGTAAPRDAAVSAEAADRDGHDAAADRASDRDGADRGPGRAARRQDGQRAKARTASATARRRTGTPDRDTQNRPGHPGPGANPAGRRPA